MDAQLTQVNSKPASFDKDGNIVKDEYASVTLNVPMDSESQREAVKDLLDILSSEWCIVTIDAKQIKAVFGESKTA